MTKKRNMERKKEESGVNSIEIWNAFNGEKWKKQLTMPIYSFIIDSSIGEECRNVKDDQVSEGRKMYEHEQIARSNELITARYKATLTENKMTVLALQNSMIDDYGRHVATFTATELKKIMGHSNGSFYQQLKDTAKKMQNRQLAIEDVEKKRFKFLSIIDTAEFNNGIFRVSFNPDVNHYIDDLRQNFTIMNMGILVDFTSSYAYRLYEILKTQEYQIDRKGDENGELRLYYTLAELKVSVGCVDTSTESVQKELQKKMPDYDKIVDELAEDKHFEKWYDFKKNVLDVAERQINQKSDLYMRYEPVRSGRGGKVQGVTFFLSRNKDYRDELKQVRQEIHLSENTSVIKNSNIDSRVNEILEYIDEYNITRAEAEAFLKKANFNVDRVKSAYNYVLTKKNVKDFVPYMITAIVNGYSAQPLPRKVQEPIFQQRGLKVDVNEQIVFDDFLDEDFVDDATIEQLKEEDHKKQNLEMASDENEEVVEEEHITTTEKSQDEDLEEAAILAKSIIDSLEKEGDTAWISFKEQPSISAFGIDLLFQVKGGKWILEQFAEWKQEHK